MFNLLNEPLIRTRLDDGAAEAMSLPEVYAALAADRVRAFPALRPHQRHAWHAFLSQLGVLATRRSGEAAPPRTAFDWWTALRRLAPAAPADEPWQLVVADPGRPAFLQCPAPGGLDAYRGRVSTPDDLDVLVNAKNHEIKQSVATDGAPDDWLFALVTLQTMAPYGGAGHYGVARMNGGFSSRPCVGLAPESGSGNGAAAGAVRPGPHLFHDIEAMLATRDGLLDRYEQYPDEGIGLTWLEPWDGTDSLGPRDLDIYFIEICRRVRLRATRHGVEALTAASKAGRITAKESRGDLGDFWTPVDTDGKALSLSSAGFRYDRLAKMLFDNKSFEPWPAVVRETTGPARWRVIARGMEAGQVRTDAYHERTDVVFDADIANALHHDSERTKLEAVMHLQLEEVGAIAEALKLGVAVAKSGGKDDHDLTKADRSHAAPCLRRLDAVVDTLFFKSSESRYRASDAHKTAARRKFVRTMRDTAEVLLDEAIDAMPCRAFRRHRARARATNAFRRSLCSANSVFADDPDMFRRKETAVSTDNECEPAAGRRPGDLRTVIPEMAHEISRLDPGPAAQLRREPAKGAGAVAFWQLISKVGAGGAVRNEEDWARVIQAIAILTRRGRRSRTKSAHGPTPMGKALDDCNVGDTRLVRFLSTPQRQRGEAAVRMCRLLAAAGAEPFDLVTLGCYVLAGPGQTDRLIARKFYQAREKRAADARGEPND